MSVDAGFKEKSGNVILVDPSGAMRAMLTEVVRSLGFQDVTGVPAIKDALSVLEIDPVKWVILPLMADQSENAMHVLQIMSQNRHLADVRMTLMLEESEMYCLPAAFQKGLINWLPKALTKDSFKSELDIFIKKFEDCDWDPTLTAAEYLRTQLLASSSYEELYSFEKSLVDLYPTRMDLLLNLVLPLVRLERRQEARVMLRRVMLLDPSLGPKVNDIAAKYLDADYKSGAKEGEAASMLDVDRVIIVDGDDSVLKNIKDAVAELGAREILTFSEGDAAISYLAENPNPSLIIHEWRLPKLPGPLFIQRAKARGAATTPLVLISSLIQKDDLPFVREMGVALVLPKPVMRQDLLRGLVNTIIQDRCPTDQYQMERKMRELLSSKKLKEAIEIFEKYVVDAKVPAGMKKAMQAEIALAENRYEDARDCGIEAIKMAGDSLFILNILGKALMHLKDFATACRCFEKAQALSPMNIERLCQLAEVHSEMGDADKAEEALDKAKAVDGDNVMVKEAEAKVAVNTDQVDRARALMSQLDTMSNVVSYMNNQAVSWARAGMVDKGIGQYLKTISAIPKDKVEVLSVVNYNLALAQVRADHLDEAQLYLNRAIGFGEFKVTPRAKSLLLRIKKALETGTRIALKGDAEHQVQQDPAKSGTTADAGGTAAGAPKEQNEVVLKLFTGRGQMGLFMLFNPPSIDARAKVLFDNPPRFTIRRAIEREEAFGADKLLKSG